MIGAVRAKPRRPAEPLLIPRNRPSVRCGDRWPSTRTKAPSGDGRSTIRRRKPRTGRALSECGEQCRVVMRFSGECAAYAADQAAGSTAYGWANGFESGAGARGRALAECQQKGGTSCIVRSWGCTRR